MLIYSFIILGYLFGSVASAIIVCKSLGLSDPRSGGSNNPGATNVLRLHGKQAAALTLAGDVLKGVFPVLIAHQFTDSHLIIGLTGLAAFLGHLYPIFFGFKGGKGVATFIGVLFATHWVLGLGFVVIWLLMAMLFRYSSLSALTAATAMPFMSFYFLGSKELIIITSIMAVLLFWRHQSNIRNLLSGKESKIGKKESDETN